MAAVLMLGALVVAATAFKFSYAGTRGAALDAGVPAGDAGAFPVNIEGALVVVAVATAVVGGWGPWLLLGGFSGLSVAANIVYARDHGHLGWSAMVFHAVPPLTMPVCLHLALLTIKVLRGRELAGNEHACEHGNEQGSEHPPLVLVSIPNEHAPDAHDGAGPDAHKPPTERSTSTRQRRQVSTAQRRATAGGVAANLVPCDAGCLSTDRAGQVCDGREVSPATRTRHRGLRRPAVEEVAAR